VPRYVTEDEVKTATKLAKRKTGVTRSELAKKLKCSTARAANVLGRIKGCKALALGEKGGKACRTLIYKA
jgi:hypothetical protein